MNPASPIAAVDPRPDPVNYWCGMCNKEIKDKHTKWIGDHPYHLECAPVSTKEHNELLARVASLEQKMEADLK